MNHDHNSNTDFIKNYEEGVQRLKANADDRAAQHQAVLALARMGSLDFAQREYKRYGLDRVRHHEDIMALGGRLSKDLYLAASGTDIVEHARTSAERYEAAYKDTGGYYSGVNAATMALLADMPADMVLARARDVAERLPGTKSVSKTEHYFIEATRAECFLLQGDIGKAAECLKGAVQFDPFNYTAHASTLKQFRLILDKRNAGTSWLDAFKPPSAAHFAGHIWQDDAPVENLSDLKIKISDALQVNDIAFGYGALAAGADILIAETLLEEGAELHIILPSDLDDFVEKSVMPFGNSWEPRFKDCMNAATSVKTYDAARSWPDATLNQTLGRVAIGHAVMRATHFDVRAKQILLWAKDGSGTFTSEHAKDWPLNADTQIIIPISKPQKKHPSENSVARTETSRSFTYTNGTDTLAFDVLEDALEAARTAVSEGLDQHIWIELSGLESDAPKSIENFETLPHGLFVSKPMAAYLTWHNSDKLSVKYAGQLSLNDRNKHIYRVRFN